MLGITAIQEELSIFKNDIFSLIYDYFLLVVFAHGLFCYFRFLPEVNQERLIIP